MTNIKSLAKDTAITMPIDPKDFCWSPSTANGCFMWKATFLISVSSKVTH